jgi:mRNA interferase MazF
MGLRRGDLAVLSAPGDYGKPRPALILQGDEFHRLDSVIAALLTSELQVVPVLFRKRIAPSDGNGLQRESEVMLDKLVTMRRDKVSGPIGRLSSSEMLEINSALALILGL